MPGKRRVQQRDDQSTYADAPDGLLDVLGAARWFGVSRTKLFELMREDDFPVMRITERVVRFDPNSLYQWALKRQKGHSRIA